MKLYWILGSLILTLSWTSAALSQTQTLPSKSFNFQPLMTDPEEPRWALESLSGSQLFGLELGGAWDMVQLGNKPGSVALGVLAGADLAIRREHWATYLLQSDDWLAGIYAAGRRGDISWRFEYRHENSNLGLEPFTHQKALDYRRQGERFVLAWAPAPRLRLYAGLGYWQFQSFAGPDWETLVGLEASTSPFSLAGQPTRFYFAYQLENPGQRQTTWNHDLQLGLRFGKSLDQWPVRLFIHYQAGKNPAGQFYREDVSYLGLGISLAP
ncbi:MAG: DUF1207 domain-containing protein [bacterium]